VNDAVAQTVKDLEIVVLLGLLPFSHPFEEEQGLQKDLWLVLLEHLC